MGILILDPSCLLLSLILISMFRSLGCLISYIPFSLYTHVIMYMLHLLISSFPPVAQRSCSHFLALCVISFSISARDIGRLNEMLIFASSTKAPMVIVCVYDFCGLLVIKGWHFLSYALNIVVDVAVQRADASQAP